MMASVNVGVLVAERLRPLTRTRHTTRSLKIRLKWGTLTELGPGHWKASWIDSGGLRHRVQFNANSPAEAERRACEIYHNPPRKGQKHTRAQAPSVRIESPMLMISDALFRSAKDRNWTEDHRKLEQHICQYFLRWADKEELVYWLELRHEHVQQYIKSLYERELALQTVLQYIKPIRRTAKWMAVNWPKDYTDICQDLQISDHCHRSISYDDETGNPVLLIHEVLDFLNWLHAQRVKNRLVLGVALQGLAGLQLQEALRLQWNKVDFESETVTIDGMVKNRYRARRIPVVGVVMWLLRKNFRTQKGADLLIPHYSEYGNYSKAVRRALRAWKPEVSIKPKDLRNTIQTAAIDAGWYGYYVQRYVGHAPSTIGERHYHGDQGKRLIPLFREQVVSHLEAEIANWDSSQDSGILPGPRLIKSSISQ